MSAEPPDDRKARDTKYSKQIKERRQMRRRVTGIVAALVLASLGTVLLVVYVQSARDEAVAGERMVDVLVVSDAIDKGTEVADMEGSVDAKQVPAKVRADGAVDDLADLDDELVAAVDLVPGEQLVATRFVTRQQAARGDVPEGLQEVTVPLEPARALGGRIAAGDTVGVFLSFDPFEIGNTGTKTGNSTHLELHKVTVTRVQLDDSASGIGSDDGSEDEGTEGTADAPAGTFLVTLAVDAPSAERVVFAAEHGFVWLSNEPLEAEEGGTSVVTRGNVYEGEEIRP
jgi:pilus assembly protein CpaB